MKKRGNKRRKFFRVWLKTDIRGKYTEKWSVRVY